MPSAARIGDQCGGVIVSGASSVVVNGSPLGHLGSKVSTHSHGNHSHTPVIISGSSNVVVEGKPVARLGDKASCVHSITTGASSVTVGG